MLSARMQPRLTFDILLKDLFDIYSENQYRGETNEQGIINLATAHNASVTDLIIDKLNQEDVRTWEASMMPYTPERTGLYRLRKAMAEFLTRQFETATDLDPEKFCLTNGVTAGLNNLAYTLCDGGDTILTHSPVYGAIPRDFLFVAGVKTYATPLSSESYKLTTETLEAALKEAREKGHKVKALLLINPVNPFGTVSSKDQLLDYLHFCKKHELHCIIDEIYGCSVYDSSVKFTSAMALDPDKLPDKSRTHVLWGMAKDFGMPGNPIGAIYTWNPDVMSALACLADFYQISCYIQVAAAKVLEDKEWLETIYLPIHRKRLQESSNITMATLDELGVPYIKPSAGLFIWVDLRKYIAEPTPEAEWKLCEYFLGKGLAIPMARAFYGTEYGWCRIVFSVHQKELLEAMRRLKEACIALLEVNSS